MGGIEARDLWVDAEPLCDAAQLQSARTLNLGRVGKRRGKPETRPSRSNPAGNPSNRPRRSAPCRFLLARNFPDSSPRVRFLWANAMSCLSDGGRAFAAARFWPCIPNPCNFPVTLSVRIHLNNCIALCKQGGTVRYADLIDGNVTKSELKTYLVGGENVAVTVRIPKNMRDIAKQAAELSGVSFTSLVKMSLIEHLAEKDN